MSKQDGSICMLVGKIEIATVEDTYSFTVVEHDMFKNSLNDRI